MSCREGRRSLETVWMQDSPGQRVCQRADAREWRLPVETHHEPVPVFLAQCSEDCLGLLQIFELPYQHPKERAF